MNILKLCFVVALASLNILFINKNLANTDFSYSVDDKKNECIFSRGNQKILLAGGQEKTYFFFPCFSFKDTYEVKTPSKNYFISELLLAPTPRNNAIFLRSIEKIGNNFTDNTDLSYLLMSCIPLKKEHNRQLVSYLLNNLESYKKTCNMDNGYITLDKKTFLYERKNNHFLIRKSYLIKGDKVTVSDYIFENNALWLFITYNDSTKKWIKFKG